MTRNIIDQHPAEYREDLNPDYGAGQNQGPASHEMRTAFEIKGLHELYSELRNDELKQIPVLTPGTRLQQGAVYLDLRHPQAGEYKAMGSEEAGSQHWLVPKSEVDHELWNRLRHGEVGNAQDSKPDEEYRGGI